MSAPVTPPRPEPVIEAARVAGTIPALVGAAATTFATLGVVTGWQWAEATAAALTAVGASLAKVLPAGYAQGARAQVTPLSDPRAMDGTPLVPADLTHSVAPTMGP